MNSISRSFCTNIIRQKHFTVNFQPRWERRPGPTSVELGNQYLWGWNILVAPVTAKDATQRSVCIPEGIWYDFWSNRRIEGGQWITRYVDLSTMPLYIWAGTILPLDPVRQYTEQLIKDPMTIRVYTGCDGKLILYEDDGKSLNYQKNKGVWTKFQWFDQDRKLVIQPDGRSLLQDDKPRQFKIRIIPGRTSRTIVYSGQKMEVNF